LSPTAEESIWPRLLAFVPTLAKGFFFGLGDTAAIILNGRAAAQRFLERRYLMCSVLRVQGSGGFRMASRPCVSIRA
jgi:hypothetical protein